MSTSDRFQIVSVERMCECLWDIFVVTNITLRFYFDIRINISVAERLESPEYYLTIASFGDVYVSIIVRSDGKELKAKTVNRRIDFVEFVQNYCNKHNPGKWKDTVCIDISDWGGWENDYE